MHIGLGTILIEGSIDIADLAPRVEELGFESIWTPEQPTLPVVTETPIPREWGDIPDPFVLLSRAAAATTTLKLGTAVCVVTERHPITLAKEVATLDMYSGGRFLFGIGTGSHREQAEIYGVDFDRRWTQAREAVAAMKELWTRDESEFHGRYYDFPPVFCYPKPNQKPHPPILLGSHVPQVFRRIVEYADGWVPIDISPETRRRGQAETRQPGRGSGTGPALDRDHRVRRTGRPPGRLRLREGGSRQGRRGPLDGQPGRQPCRARPDSITGALSLTARTPG